MKVLIYSNQGLAPLHLGIELEIIEKLREEGNQLFIVKCDNVLEGCYFNPCHNLLGCAICEARSDVFYKKIGIKKEQVFKLKEYPEAYSMTLPFFNNLNELLAFEYEGVNLGRGVASSIISLRRDSDINSHNDSEFIDYQLRMALNVYFNFSHYLNKFKPDLIYLFNGRFAECHPVIGLAKKHNITFKTIEVSSSKHRYELFENTLPQSLQKRIADTEKQWNAADPIEREEVAIRWFEEKRKGTVKIGLVFTDSQTPNKLPDNFDSSKMNIVIFNSSEDELKVIEDWKFDIFETQNEAITTLVKHYEGNPNFHFYLRVHPNLGKVDNTQSRGIEKMDFENLTVIPAFSDVDTYSLMDECDKTLTFGSSTGLEATYWRKPSILLGKSWYQTFNCVYHPKAYDELFELIDQEQLPPKTRESTYKRAYYLYSYGRPYRHFEFNGKFDSYYRKEKMKRTYPRTVLYFFKYLYNFKKWIKYNYIVRRKSIFKSDITKLR